MSRILPKGREGITYLTAENNSGKFYSNVLRVFDQLPAKLQKAPPAQWVATLKSLSSKGAKGAELEDFEMLDAVGSRQGITKQMTREEVRDILEASLLTIKEIERNQGSSIYRGFSHAAPQGTAISPGGPDYGIVFLVLNSRRDDANDRLDEIDWELDSFSFDVEALTRDPDAVFRLLDERKLIEGMVSKLPDFQRHHWDNDDDLKNLILHMRYSVHDGLFLLEEIQSDWAQSLRKQGQGGRVPEAPFIKDTKVWAQLGLHRIMQIAAKRTDVNQFAWIRGHMRNGWNGDPDQARDGLDEFYTKTVRSIVKKRIDGAGDVTVRNVVAGKGPLNEVLGFDVTDAVREKMAADSPMYSLTRLRRPNEPQMSEQQRLHILEMGQQMLGSARHVMCMRSVTDLDTLQQVAGSYLKGVVRVNVNARNPVFVFNHEAFHFAQDNFMSEREKKHLDEMFAPGTRLNAHVRHLLLEANDQRAANQCLDPREAQAHGFAFWCEGRLPVAGLDAPQQGFLKRIFGEVKSVLQDMAIWLNLTARKEKDKEGEATVEGVFARLHTGFYARQGERDRESSQDLESLQQQMRERAKTA